jgi:hypothetical protein
MLDKVFSIYLALKYVRCLKFAYEAPNSTEPNQTAVNWPMLALFPFSGKEAPDQVDSLD